jgi:hypothetical protein
MTSKLYLRASGGRLKPARLSHRLLLGEATIREPGFAAITVIAAAHPDTVVVLLHALIPEFVVRTGRVRCAAGRHPAQDAGQRDEKGEGD